MRIEEVHKFEKIQSQIEGLYKEIGLLSKKNPNDAINEFKLKFINQILINANSLLLGKYKPLDDFNKFDNDLLPSNSDVTMIFEQYLTCMEKLRSDNIKNDFGNWFWRADNTVSDIETSRPEKLWRKK